MCFVAPISPHAKVQFLLFTHMKRIPTLRALTQGSIASLMLIATPIACASEEEATSIFDGKTLAGWKVVKESNAKFWDVVDGVITGDNDGNKVPTNTYLATEKEYGDFEFRCKFRISGDHKTGLINSGIQYRSIIKDSKITGYQADIGRKYWGDIYDEHRRGLLIKGDTKKLMENLVEDGWNDYLIRCNGDTHEIFINGVKTATYTEKKQDIPAKGVIALQLHSGGVAKVEFKDITIKEL